MAFSSRRVAATWLSSFVREARTVEAKAYDLFDNFPDEDDDEAPEPVKKEPEKAPEKAKKPRAPAKPKAPKKEPEKAPEKKPSRKHDLFDNFPDEDDAKDEKPESPDADPLYEKFLGERYEAGKAQVANPVRENRERYPNVSFATAMKNQFFRKRVEKEFEDWKGKLEDDKGQKQRAPEKDEDKKPSKKKNDEAPRLEIGQVIENIASLRPGDVIKSDRKGSPYRRVVEVKEDGVLLQEIDEDGDFGRTQFFPARSVDHGSHKRVQDPVGPTKRKEKEEAAAKKEKEKADAARAKKEKEEARRKKIKEKTESYPAWRKKQQALLDVALEGTVTKDKPLGGGVNTSIKRKMKLGNKAADFVWKPKSGEAGGYRSGIAAGEYHQREAAGYAVDALFGDDTVVPPTTSSGEGSYQLFQPGSETFLNGNLRLFNEHLEENEDFHRIMFLDQVLGHEDRHHGNIMFKKDGDNIRFIAIDNGLALADPADKESPADYVMREPWTYLGGERTDERQEMIKRVLSDMPKKMHERIKAVKLDDFVDALVESGITNERVLRASAARLVAFQRNPNVLADFVEEYDNPLNGTKDFQYASGKNPAKLLEDAGGEGHSLEDINEAIKRALQ